MPSEACPEYSRRIEASTYEENVTFIIYVVRYFVMSSVVETSAL